MERFNDDEYNLKIEDIVISSVPEDTFFIRQCSVKNLKAFWLLRIPTVVAFAWIESLYIESTLCPRPLLLFYTPILFTLHESLL